MTFFSEVVFKFAFTLITGFSVRVKMIFFFHIVMNQIIFHNPPTKELGDDTTVGGFALCE